VSKLNMPHVFTYLDAAHTGWLGWEGNRQKIAKIFKDVLTEAGGIEKIRGFATNVSNYNTVSAADGKKLGPANPCPDEGSYITKLTEALNAEGITGKQFIIDTARNGRVVRTTWGSWCNAKGAGLGPRPQASPMPLVDAFFWVKPPGESDGTSDPKAARFDASCAVPDAMPNAPEAGQWFPAQFLELARNAEPAL
jgi:cellulose 1,4-beta-cellobiosidase